MEDSIEFTRRLQNQNCCAGEQVKLFCTVKSSSGKPYFVKWYHSGKVLKPESIERVIIKNDRKTGIQSLFINPVMVEDEGPYRCVVMSEDDRISTTCYVQVKAQSPQVRMRSPFREQTTSSVCGTPCDGLRTWHKSLENVEEEPDEEISPTKEEELKMEFILSLPEKLNLNVGEELCLSCLVRANGEVQSTWYKDGLPLEENPRIKMHTDRTSHNLHIRDLTCDDQGEYSIVITGRSDTTLKAATRVLVKQPTAVPRPINNYILPTVFQDLNYQRSEVNIPSLTTSEKSTVEILLTQRDNDYPTWEPIVFFEMQSLFYC